MKMFQSVLKIQKLIAFYLLKNYEKQKVSPFVRKSIDIELQISHIFS